MESLPITYVSYHSALRFCNWYQHGQPTREQGDQKIQASTEEGSAFFVQLPNGEEQAVACDNARYFLPNEDQWMKGVYHLMLDGAEWVTQFNSSDTLLMIPTICNSALTDQKLSEHQRSINSAPLYDSSAAALGEERVGFRIATIVPYSALANRETASIVAKKEAPTISTKGSNKTLKCIEDLIQWMLFSLDVVMLLWVLGEIIASVLCLILVPEFFAIVMTEIPFLALCFSIETPFSLILLPTVLSFLMDWITKDGYTTDIIFLIVDTLNVFI
jgi:hypothetical protein